MEKFYAIIVCAIAIESIFEIIKGFVKEDKKPNVTMILSAIGGILVAINYNLDMLEVLGLNGNIPYFGIVLTGIAISRGSNYIHDVLKQLVNVNVNINDSTNE